MKAAPEEFDALKKLLALKRHEQPPPGYFDQLPRTIRARIQAGVPEAQAGFWETLFHRITLRPAAAYSAVGIACLGLVVGFGVFVNPEPGADPYNPQVETSAQVFDEHLMIPLGVELASTNVEPESSMQPLLPQHTPSFFLPTQPATSVNFSPGQ
jgi:hypothetical protein